MTDEQDIYSNGSTQPHPPPISPVIIIKTKGFKSYRKSQTVDKTNGIVCNVWSKSEWYSDECSRKSAELHLKFLKNGTFLIRKCSQFNENGCYALSIAFNHHIYHCLIHKFSNGFGFDSTRIFSTLEDLVSHYKNIELLSVHNILLDTHLTVPANNCQLITENP